MGLREELTEQVRSFNSGDDKYYKSFFLVFELLIPKHAVSIPGTGQVSFYFPLMVNPTSYSMDEPFAHEVTPSLFSGLFADESGIIEREISIRGHTGFKPHRLPVNGTGFAEILNRKEKTYSRSLKYQAKSDFSGQRHFQFLQDGVFRTYSDLKRDPSTSAETAMNFHNLKDDEHWRVIPKRFRLERNASDAGRVLYYYDIQLLAVEKAKAYTETFEADKGLIESARDVLRTVNAGVNKIRAGIIELTAMQAEIKRFAQNVGTILYNAVSIADAAANLINGVTDTIRTPFNLALSTAQQAETALRAFDNAGSNFPDEVRRSWMTMLDGIDQIMTRPELFELDTNRQIRALTSTQSLNAQDQDAIAAAASEASPSTLDGYDDRQSPYSQGDALRAQADLGLGVQTEQYSNAIIHVIHGGDTLPNIAAKYLGDARRWRIIALLNGLSFPYITEAGLPDTVTVGDKILIPTNQQPATPQSFLPILGVSPSATPEERLFGADFKLVSATDNSTELFDWAVDTEKGSKDLKIVKGVENISQACITRLATEQGSDTFYPGLGSRKIIGTGLTEIDRLLVPFRVSEAITADPRVVAVSNIRSVENFDQVKVELDAQILGFSEATKIPLET